MKEYIVPLYDDYGGSLTNPELIRCKDCRYWRTQEGKNNYCDHDFAGLKCVPMAEDYCSYAEEAAE